MSVNMKKNIIFLLILFLSFLTFLPVNAEELGSIKGTYSYDNNPFTNQNIYLYKIADVKDIESDNKYTYLENYSEFDSNINSLSSSEWQNYANELKNYITTNNITYDAEAITDDYGNYEFNELNNCLYLILVDEIILDSATYTSLPTLISVPSYDATIKKYINNITVKTKIEKTKHEPAPKPIEPAPEVPQTSDNIVFYAITFVLAAIILICIGAYIYKSKKELDANVKNKD